MRAWRPTAPAPSARCYVYRAVEKPGYAEVRSRPRAAKMRTYREKFCLSCEGERVDFREIPIPITDIGNLLSILNDWCGEAVGGQ